MSDTSTMGTMREVKVALKGKQLSISSNKTDGHVADYDYGSNVGGFMR